MSIVYRIGEILCILITMDLIRLPSPTGVAVEVWSTVLPNWGLGVRVDIDLAAWMVNHSHGTDITYIKIKMTIR